MAKNSKRIKEQKRNANYAFQTNLQERRIQKHGEPKTVNLYRMVGSLLTRVYSHVKKNLWGQAAEIDNLPAILKTLPFALPRKQKFLEPDEEGYIKVLIDYGGERLYLDINLSQFIESYNAWLKPLKVSNQQPRNYAVM